MVDTDTAAPPKSDRRTRTARPRRFAVIMLNDDFTPVDFVVAVLVHHFGHTEVDAHDLAWRIHNDGEASVAEGLSHEIAETKVAEVHAEARNAGHPLACRVDPMAD